jgi:hypothetical protein
MRLDTSCLLVSVSHLKELTTGGGGTITSILLGQPPSWLISPAPWMVLPLAYALLIPTGMASYVTRTAPALFLNLVFAAIDGLTRGTTIAALAPALVSARVASTGWTYTLLSGIAVSGGGFIVSLLGLHESKWTLAKPSILDGGILNTLDCWGAMLVAAVYSSLLRLHPELDVFATRILPWIPAKLVTLGPTEEQPAAAVHPEAGRAVCVLLLGLLLGGRAVIQAVVPKDKHTVASKKNNKKKEPAVMQKEEVTVVKSPAKPERTKVTPRRSTPSKSPKPKPKSK